MKLVFGTYLNYIIKVVGLEFYLLKVYNNNMEEAKIKTEMLIHHGDITKLEVDVIVNAANNTLSSGSGVDGAIHAAAGPELLKECQTMDGCQIGQAKISKGYNLPAKHIIHTVGPAYGSDDGLEDDLLADCYRNSLNLAKQHQLKTIAFPNISTGVFRYPKDEAAEIALSTVWQWVKDHPEYIFSKIIFVSYTEQDYKLNKEHYQSFKFN